MNNGEISKHFGQRLDSKALCTVSLEDFKFSEIKNLNSRYGSAFYGFKFFSHDKVVSEDEAPSVLDTTKETHINISLEFIEESYAKLAPNQQLIGVHGYFCSPI